MSRHIKSAVLITAVLLITTTSKTALACACGCGVFDVGTNTMFPSGPGGTASLEYDYMNQHLNWSGTSTSASANNSDKEIISDFYTAGLQYMFNRSWGMNVDVPYTNRSLSTDTGGGDIETFRHNALGDVRMEGIYTGFSPDMSTGLEFGLKLPTGGHNFNGFDPDTQIGTGSTNVLLGAYHRDRFGQNNPYNWFVHGLWNEAVLTQSSYRPGSEFDAAAGVIHDPMPTGDGIRAAPVLQLLNSYRVHDSGVNADPVNTGYERVLISPGIEFSLGSAKLYTDVSLPVYQNVNGNQLVAPVLFQAIVSYDF